MKKKRIENHERKESLHGFERAEILTNEKSQAGGPKIRSEFEIRFEKQFAGLLNQSQKLNSTRFLVGVSGGLDSMVLLELVALSCSPENLVVAYFDHRMRKSTQKDQKAILERCCQLGIKNVIMGARKGRGVSENDLRNERHTFLRRVMKESRANYIVLGHHAHDQCETLLMRLIRGTGPDGLASMSKKQGQTLRPLLSFTKNEIREYAMQKQIRFVEDETNQSHLYFRNRIRHKIIPILAETGKDFGGEKELIMRIVHLTDELQVIKLKREKWTRNWCRKHIKKNRFWWSFSLNDWLILEPDEKRLVSRFLWKKLTKESLQLKDIFQLEESILRRKSVTLSSAVQVSISFDTVFLVSEKHRAETRLKNEKIWEWCCSSGDKNKLQKKLLNLNAELRFLASGDRFKKKKIKKIFHELKIPRPQRALIPVVAKRGTSELIWYFPCSGQLSQWIGAPWESQRKSRKKNSSF